MSLDLRFRLREKMLFDESVRYAEWRRKKLCYRQIQRYPKSSDICSGENLIASHFLT